MIAFLAGRDSAPAPAPAPEPPQSAATPAPTAVPAGSLALGITEPNPAFLGGSGQPAFDRWQPELAAIRPAYYRLVIDWAGSAGSDGAYDPAAPQAGCLRDQRPCAGWAGVRAQLDAVAAAQRAAPGSYRVLAVITGTPERYGRPPGLGCEGPDTQARSRPPRDDALPAYSEVIRAVLAQAREAGVQIAYWSPWNEPNHAYFLSPQRRSCAASAPTAAVEPYVAMARALRATLAAEPGEQQIVLGELGGIAGGGARSTRLGEFVDALPDDVACSAPVFGVHDYAGNGYPVGPVFDALQRRDCPRIPEIWVTETGAKAPRFSPEEACRAIHRSLVRYYRDPRVAAAFQYTLRDDDLFPTGLVSTDLRRALPALAEWQAWGARPERSSQPPAATCSS